MIEKNIHQIWIGDLEAPTEWLETWPKKNPDWNYIFWDNKKVFSRKWKNQKLIDHYRDIAENTKTFQSATGKTFTGEKAKLFAWHIIADILRYEILFEFGGYMPGADTICTKSLTENASWLDYDLYTVNTGHLFEDKLKQLDPKNPHYSILKDRYHQDNASPILAGKKGNIFLKQIIDELSDLKVLGEAVDTTGNVFMGKMLNKYKPENILINKYYLQDDPRRKDCYSRHFSGTTKDNYNLGRKGKDIVYILGSESRWANNEIRYSLRSVQKNLKHGKIFVIGEKCDWFSDKIIHIPAEDPFEIKTKNAYHKLLIACNDKRISDNFILMNDDFFILNKIPEIKPYYKCTLAQSIKRHKQKAGYYFNAIEETIKYLGNKEALDYSLHYPFIYNKAKLKKLLLDIEKKDIVILLRAAYGNIYNLNGIQKDDVKIKNAREFKDLMRKKEPVISTDDFIVKFALFGRKLKQLFKDKSVYEK